MVRGLEILTNESGKDKGSHIAKGRIDFDDSTRASWRSYEISRREMEPDHAVKCRGARRGVQHAVRASEDCIHVNQPRQV
jgi:hypothetical protein